MNFVWFALVSLFCVIVVVFLREINPDYILPVCIVTGAVLFIQIIPLIVDVWGYSDSLISKAVSGSNIKILYKAIGTAFLCQYVVEICHESGVEHLASRLELVGKIYITALCLPLVEELISSVSSF